MKRYYIFPAIVALLLIATSCSDDNPVNSRSGDLFENVPSGEIVPVAERDFVLTGFSDGSAKALSEGSQRWWLQIVSKFEFNNCGDEDDEDVTLQNTYFGFAPDGWLYVRSGQSGTPQQAARWAWSSSNKTAINLNNITEVDFQLTALNQNQVVYASVQNIGQGCSVVTWEQFGQPFTD